MTQHSVSGMSSDSDDGDISVGCPSPVPLGEDGKRARSDDDERPDGDEYFKPLKKLKMMSLAKKRREEETGIALGKQYPIHKGLASCSSRAEEPQQPPPPPIGLIPPIPIPIPVLRHFPAPGLMLLDNRSILEHRQLLERNLYLENRHLFERSLVENRFLMSPHLLTAADTRHLLTPEQRNVLGIENRFLDPKALLDQRHLLEARMFESSRLGLDPSRDPESQPNGVKSFSILDILNHRPRKDDTRTEGKIVRPWAEKAEKPTDLCYSETLSTCSSERSSTAGSIVGSASECCTSPDIVCSVSGTSGGTSRQQRGGGGGQGKSAGGKNTSPLDALFQMTSKTFDGMNGEPSSGKLKNSFDGPKILKETICRRR